MALNFGLGLGFRRVGNGGGGGGAVAFTDGFSGSADDPSVDSTKWLQLTRTPETTGVDTGKLAIDRVAFNASGYFTAYAKSIYENGVSDTFKYVCNPTNQSGHLIGLMVRHVSKTSTKVDNENTDTPDGYEVVLHDESWGDLSYVKRWNSGVGTLIGAAFTATGLAAGSESAVEIIVAAGAGQVDFTIKVDAATVATRADNGASRITAAGYSGLAIKSDWADGMTIDDFQINP